MNVYRIAFKSSWKYAIAFSCSVFVSLSLNSLAHSKHSVLRIFLRAPSLPRTLPLPMHTLFSLRSNPCETSPLLGSTDSLLYIDFVLPTTALPLAHAHLLRFCASLTLSADRLPQGLRQQDRRDPKTLHLLHAHIRHILHEEQLPLVT